jgi:predicted O-methyltransferase YrrM
MRNNTLELIHEKSIQNNIPVVRPKTIDMINNIIVDNNFSTILEIGTAYGYSAQYMSLNDCVQKIVTVEKNESNYNVAKSSLLKNQKIKCINANAFDVELNEKFDFIFIDGPKSHQEELVKKFVKLLNKNGIMVIDNIYLKKFTRRTTLTKDQRKLLEKVKQFETWLRNNVEYNVEIKDVDDGVAILKYNTNNE